MQKELEEQQATAPKKTAEKKAVPTAPKKETSRSKTNYAVLSTDKLTMLIQRCEATIAMFEAELKGLEYQMNDPILQQDPKKSHEIAQAYAQKEQELDDKYQEWEKLTDQLSAK